MTVQSKIKAREGKIIIQVDPDIEELIPGFLENRQQDVKEILKALKNDDFETIRILGHTM